MKSLSRKLKDAGEIIMLAALMPILVPWYLWDNWKGK